MEMVNPRLFWSISVSIVVAFIVAGIASDNATIHDYLALGFLLLLAELVWLLIYGTYFND